MRNLQFGLIYFLISSVAYGQSLCNTQMNQGGFEILVNGEKTDTGCTPLEVQVNDLSGGDDLRYMFIYGGESENSLDWVGSTETKHTYTSTNQVNYYTILQYGFKNGEKIYSCKNLVVYPDIKPDFTYEICNTTAKVKLTPNNSYNYDNYFIYWEEGEVGVPLNTIGSVSYNYSSFEEKRVITVEGKNNGPTGCTAKTKKIITTSRQVLPSPQNITASISEINSISIISNSDSNPADLLYYLYVEEEGSYLLTDSMSSLIDFKYTMDNYNKSYCFKVGAIDECQNATEISKPACSIFLENNNNTFSWSKASPFSNNEPLSYKLITIGENNSTEYNFPPSQFSTNLPIDQRNDGSKYFITSIDSDSSTSFSNSVSPSIGLTIWIPTVFTPNGDNKNDLFKYYIPNSNYSNVEMTIYNKWGNIIYLSNAEEPFWNGSYKNKPAPKGTYLYTILYNKEFRKTGSFELIR